MRKLLSCAVSVAAFILAAQAADTAVPRKKVPTPAAKTQSASKAAPTASKTAPTATKGAATASKNAATASKAAVASKNAPASKTTPHTAASTKPAASSAARTATATRRVATPAPPRRSGTTWRNRQMSPTPDRYKEIQDALAAKGYLQPEDASGRWDQTSIDALKKFQADQKLESTGKINSLSLIALGLGPKYGPPAPAKPADPSDNQ